MPTQIQLKYREHGERIVANVMKRLELYNMMKRSDEFAELEKYLCNIDYIPDFKNNHGEYEPTGIIRFFEYHLWTHEPRGHILKAYHPKIKSPELPFILFDFQKKAVLKLCDALDKGYDVLVEKSRDMGVSWLAISVFFYYWWRNEKGNDFLLGSRKFEYVDKKGATDTLFEKFRYNLYRLQPSMFPEGFEANKNDNVGLITNPSNGNYVRGEANNANFATSGRYKGILVDEYAKWEETDEAAWTSMGDSSPCRIAVSTPWGIGRKFAKLRFSGDIEVLSFHWSEHPIKGAGKHRGQHPVFKDKHDVWLSEWYLNEVKRRKGNAQADIGQELDIDYLSSGTPYFNNELMQKKFLESKVEGKGYEFERVGDTIELIENQFGNIRVVEEPVSAWKYRYLISADVAEGLAKGDYSVMYVFDRVTGLDVAWYVGHVDTTTFALILSYFGFWYNDAYIGVENNNHGLAVIQKLKEIYVNLFHEIEFGKVVDIEKIRLGWNTNNKSRPVMFGELREALNQGVDGILDAQFFQEAMTFVLNERGKPEADEGCYDDRIAAQAIKWQVHKWLPSPFESKELKEEIYGVERWGGSQKVNKKDVRSIW